MSGGLIKVRTLFDLKMVQFCRIDSEFVSGPRR